MLFVDNEKREIISSEIRFTGANIDRINGYSILIEIIYAYNKKREFLTLSLDFFNDINFDYIENKTYIDVPTKRYSKIRIVEITEAKNLIKYIKNDVKVIFGSVENNTILTEIIIDIEYLKINYKGNLDIVI